MMSLGVSFGKMETTEFLKSIARHIVNGEKINGISYFLKGHKGSIEFLLNKASMLLPNSDNEYSRLKKSYKFENRYIKVPNAVSSDFFWNSNDRSSRDGVIGVGSIEGRKNQLILIRALQV